MLAPRLLLQMPISVIAMVCPCSTYANIPLSAEISKTCEMSVEGRVIAACCGRIRHIQTCHVKRMMTAGSSETSASEVVVVSRSRPWDPGSVPRSQVKDRRTDEEDENLWTFRSRPKLCSGTADPGPEVLRDLAGHGSVVCAHPFGASRHAVSNLVIILLTSTSTGPATHVEILLRKALPPQHGRLSPVSRAPV